MALIVDVGGDVAKLRAAMQEGQGLINKFTEQAHEMAVGLAGAFALERIAEFSKEISELAAKAAGVKTAFEEIPHSTALLADMRMTVKGTVDDLDLMKDAVRAQNLGIPLQDLGTILEFVHQRALATGGSFTEMAQTVITGIGKGGRGMIGAMSELQISTERYKEAVKETGSVAAAVMKLAQEEIEKSKGKANEFNETLEQTGASWENTKEKLGEYINKSTFLNELLKNFNTQLQVWGNENFTFWQKLSGGAEDYKNMVAAVNEEQLKLARDAKNAASFADLYAPKATVEIIKNIEYYENQIKDLKEEKVKLVGQELTDNEKLTAEYEKQLKVLNNQYQTVLDAAKEAAKIQKRADLINLQNTIGPDTKQSDLEHMAATKLVANSESGSMQDFLTSEMDTSGPDHNKILENYFKRMHESIKDINKEMSNMGKLADVAANSLVGAFKSVIDGSQNAAQALGHFVEEFGLQMLSMALMGIIGTAMNPGSNGGNYYVALALAGAGIAAVGALFAKAGVKGGVPISGANGGGPNGYGNDPNSFYAQQQGMINSNLGNRVFEFKFQPINGTQLQAVIVNQQRIDNQVKGG